MSTLNARGHTITALFTSERTVYTSSLWQYDYGQKLIIEGLTLPETYEVHFSNTERGTSTTQIGDASGVLIPDTLLTNGKAIYAWIVLHDDESDGETEYKIVIPVKGRSKPTDEVPTPEEQSAILQMITALTEGVQRAEAARNDAISSAPTIVIEDITGGHRVSVTDVNGTNSFDVMNGNDGAQGSQGPKGDTGEDGNDGYSPTIDVTEITGGHRVSVTDVNGTSFFDVMDSYDVHFENVTPNRTHTDKGINSASTRSLGITGSTVKVFSISSGTDYKLTRNGAPVFYGFANSNSGNNDLSEGGTGGSTIYLTAPEGYTYLYAQDVNSSYPSGECALYAVDSRFDDFENNLETIASNVDQLPETFYSNGLFLSNSVDNAVGVHNSIYRGKNLGTSFTAEQSAEISSGRFTDLFIGDYWTLNGRVYRIACFDLAFNCGDTSGVGAITASNKHHIAVVPDACLYNAQMHNTESGAYEPGNTANTTAGGYTNSDMRTTNLAQATSIIEGGFGSAHVLSYRDILTTSVGTYQGVTNVANAWAWADCRIELMSEIMVYGTKIWGNGPYEGGIFCFQLPLFRLNPRMIHIRANYWLRSVVSATSFAIVNSNGYAHYASASYVSGVRPFALIY